MTAPCRIARVTQRLTCSEDIASHRSLFIFSTTSSPSEFCATPAQSGGLTFPCPAARHLVS
jgi:hypothetical protein